ncbi:MAG: polysaccharide biosynthesis protein [Oscillospiraceae bacterium]|nr:polysaccharide biosynthesis protein [Oscillospiraceae bacterium]MCR4760772.1 polysaccharide biosynthesis protein [Oscillospiraceae bacterium]
MKSKFKKYVSSFSHRKMLLAVADGFILVTASLITNYLLSLLCCGIPAADMVVPIVIGTICCFAFLSMFGAYSKMWRYFRSKDYLSCVFGVIFGVSVTCLFAYVLDKKIPPVFALAHMVIGIIGICLFRLLFRKTFIEMTGNEHRENQFKRTMIIGGGMACRMLLTEIKNAKKSPYEGDKISAQFTPICIIDDDRNKVGSDVMGVEIVGTTADIERFAKEKEIEQIIFAVPSAVEDERARVMEICSKTKVPVKIVPFIGNLIFDDKTPLLQQVRDIKVEDLLGRDPIKFDNEDIRKFISGKVCMVTGGGGSIGSELVRQIAKYQPKQVIIVDIYENNAYEIQQELVMEYGKSLDLVTLIASVRDYYRINQIFKKYKPQVVFHAAAHKHVPLMEVSPMEAIKNNIVGTFNVATLAQFHLVEKFVMISTDKAVNPTNVMGASKRCCEMIVQYLSQQNDGRTEFVTTRFGNVLGSNGSVIPLFKKQIEQGKPVTVTHPDVIRYFMTIPEAVSLVMEAAAIAKGGEIFVLDMGKPVRIVALAENLIRMYGKVPYKDVEIKFVGLRPGEKIKEELLMDEEGLQKTANKLIYIGQQIQIDSNTFAMKLRILRDAAQENKEAVAVAALHEMVPTFVTPEEFNNHALHEHADKVPAAADPLRRKEETEHGKLVTV